MIDFLTAWQWWLQSFLSTTLVLLCAVVAAAMIRQPARRKRIMELALLGCLVAVVLAAIPGLPRWSLFEWLVDSSASRDAAQVRRLSIESNLPAANTDDSNSAATEAVEPMADTAENAELLAAWRKTSEQLRSSGDPAAVAVADSPGLAVGASVLGLLTLGLYALVALMMSLYALGVLAMSLWWLCGLAAVWRVVRKARPATADEQNLLAQVVAASPWPTRQTNVRLLLSDRARQPFTFTWLVPTIVLPQSLVEGDARRLRWSLAHEWAHVAAGDARWWSLSGMARVLLFYQPLVYSLRRQLRLCQDYLADSAAMGETGAEDYAEFLTHCVARMSSPARPAELLGIGGGKSELHRRVAMLVQPQVKLENHCPRRWSIGAAVVAVCVVLFAVATSISEQPAQAIEPAEPSPASAKDSTAGEAEHGDPRATQKNLEAGLAWLQKQQKVDTAIQNAVAHLRNTQQVDGSWPDVPGSSGGVTALSTLALLQAGTRADDPQLQKAIASVRTIEPTMTYVVALQTLALCAGQPQADMALIRRNVAWLEKTQSDQGVSQTPAEAFQAFWLGTAERHPGAVGGWSYQGNAARADGSNTFFALLALDAAQRAGAEIKLETWQAALDYWMVSQTVDGGWPYTPGTPVTPTMTAAGVASLSIAFRHCAGDDESDETHAKRAAAVDRGVAWLTKNWPVASPTRLNTWHFYYLHTLSAAARQSGHTQFGEHTWKQECSDWLLSRQKADGSWTGGATEQNAALATSFAVIFLCAEKKAGEKSASAAPQPAKAGTISPLDVLRIDVMGTFLGQDIQGDFIVEPGGDVALGPAYGRVSVNGLSYQEAEAAITTKLKKILKNPEVSVTMGGWKNGLPEDPRVRRLENELRSLKSTVEALQREKAEKEREAEPVKP